MVCEEQERKAATGYINKTDEAGKKLISPIEPQANILRWAFNQISEGVYNTEQIFKMAKEKDLPAQKVCFGLPFVILSTVVKYLFLNTRMKRAVL